MFNRQYGDPYKIVLHLVVVFCKYKVDSLLLICVHKINVLRTYPFYKFKIFKIEKWGG